MKFHVIGCSGGQAPGHNVSSYLVNDSALIDAGLAAGVLNLKSQKNIENVLITHAHLDHVMALGGLFDIHRVTGPPLTSAVSTKPCVP
ncbi:MAG: MBL fold metallo-hydrolase [Candidatus Binatia bacterium]